MFLFDGKPIILRPWEPNVKITKVSVKTVPIWVKFAGVDLKFWGKKCLEKLASLIEKFIRIDDVTLDKTLLGYAKILVEVDIDLHFPDKIMFEDETGQSVTVLVEYDWLPITCQKCKGIGHQTVKRRGRSRFVKKPAVAKKVPVHVQVLKKKDNPVLQLDPKEYPILPNPAGVIGDKRKKGIQLEERINNISGLFTPANTLMPLLSSYTHARIINRVTRHESRLPGVKEGELTLDFTSIIVPESELVDKGGRGGGWPLHPMTKLGVWNVRGLNSDTKKRDIKWFLYQSEVVLFGLLETRVKPGSLNKVAANVCNGWSFLTNHSCHSGGRIWVLWQSQIISVTVVDMGAQFIHLKVNDLRDSKTFYATYVYGFNKIEERVSLWDAFLSWNVREPWIVLGDFNNVMFANERIGLAVKDSEMIPFQNTMAACDLQDIKTTGAFFA
ncbi:uncharacterized protein LOC141631389 [Silene latifolia]|uniref:uncharacterized protein LOC141631389 n=1 Tax=Silene latifolia TaxID=37657 RepID=UPI003D773D8B